MGNASPARPATHRPRNAQYRGSETGGASTRERIHLEICPTANVQIISSIRSMEEHPIDRLYRAGVSLNVNSDSRMLTPTTLIQESDCLQRVFNWTEQDLLRANLMGLDAAFVDDDVKQRLRKRFPEPSRESAPSASAN